MKSHEDFRTSLQAVVAGDSLQNLYRFIEDNVEGFFSSPYISEYYQIIKNCDISASEGMLPKLIKAWLAFLCGDNAGLNSTLRYINESDLKGSHESSLYYALKALTVFSPEGKEVLKYGKLSIDVLPQSDKSLYMANAKLTYAQILAGTDQYRAASELFREAYDLFYSMDMHFPAAIALVNEMLNRYKIGEFIHVINSCNNALLTSASFREDVSGLWDVIHLPLGMCYFEMNKPGLAIRHLKQAKECIDSMSMFHMHGFIEQYLFKCYYVLNDKTGMQEVKDQAAADFEPMHYTYTDLLVSMFRIAICEWEYKQEIQPDIERFELEYMKSGDSSHSFIIETLAYLKLTGASDTITINDIVKRLEKLRFVGMIPHIQLFLVLLAEMHMMNNNRTYAIESLKEAAEMYKEYGIGASFNILPLKSSCLLKDINQKLYNETVGRGHQAKTQSSNPVLSAREREIMQLVAEGKSNDEISKILFIGVGTIKWHINHIFSKLEVKNRVNAVQKAKSLGEIN